MKCPVCEGKGTQWLGTEAEAECGFCKGTGEACDECAVLNSANAQLTHERVTEHEAWEAWKKASRALNKQMARERDAARACFRRACEHLDSYGLAFGHYQSANTWEQMIVSEVKKELEEKKP